MAISRNSRQLRATRTASRRGLTTTARLWGSSGTCASYDPNSLLNLVENNALLWENAMVTDLGDLGGTAGFAGNHACAINNQGEVVDLCRTRRQALVVSSEQGDGNAASGTLWEAGAPVDLNAKIASNPGNLTLQDASSIKSRGQIVGLAQARNGETHRAF